MSHQVPQRYSQEMVSTTSINKAKSSYHACDGSHLMKHYTSATPDIFKLCFWINAWALGAFVWKLALGRFRSGSFTWANDDRQLCLRVLSCGIFRQVTVFCDPSLGIFVRERSPLVIFMPADFRVESTARERWLENFPGVLGLRICLLEKWASEAGKIR